MSESSEQGFKVVIVGAGTSGLLLALMLELCGVDFVVLERKPEFRPPSRACILGPIIMPLFEQIGLLQETKDISLPARRFRIQRYDHPGEDIGEFDSAFLEARYGYPFTVMPKPALYNILLSKIPERKILLGKRVLSTSQSESGIRAKCSDGTYYSGEVLVGADGPNSAVRQNMYQQLRPMNSVHPKSSSLKSMSSGPLSGPQSGSNEHVLDERNRADTTWSVMGITEPLDKDLFPDIGQPHSDFVAVMGQKSKEVLWSMPAADRRLLWAIVTPVEKSDKTLCDDGFMASELGPEATAEMYSKFQHFECPIGGTMREIFEQSPPHLMCRMLTQDRVYDKWCEGRTVLIGNAVHKFPPSAGLNDSINMAESVTLANLLHELGSKGGFQEIRAGFEQFQAEREPHARRAMQLSRQLNTTFTDRGIVAGISRKVNLLRSAEVAWGKVHDQMHKERLQATFLPMIPQRGEMYRVDPRPSLVPRRKPTCDLAPNPQAEEYHEV